MQSAIVGITILGFTFGAALVGMKLRTILPPDHLTGESRSAITAGIGLIATATALVLGLVITSAKSSFDATNAGIGRTAADLLALDRTLARYGPETTPIRAALKRFVAHRFATIWPRTEPGRENTDPSRTTQDVESLVAQIHALRPGDDYQAWLRSHSLDRAELLLQERWLVFGLHASAIPVPFLIVLSFWLTVTFLSFGLFAARNATVLFVLFFCAVSIACAIVLVLELDAPFAGFVRAFPDPLEYTLARLNQ